MDETDFLRHFQGRQSGSEKRAAWLDAFDSYTNILASDRPDSGSVSFEARRALAHSAQCFWHEPLVKYMRAHPTIPGGGSSTAINPFVLSKAVRNVFGSQQSEGKNVSMPKDKIVLKDELERRAVLCASAFKTAAQPEAGYRKFQRDLTELVIEKLSHDEALISHASAWPNFEHLEPEEVLKLRQCELSSQMVARLKAIDTGAFAERVAGHLFAAAKALRPDIFSDLPPFVPKMFDPTFEGGTYGYNDYECKFGFGEKNAETLFGPVRLIIGCTHEGEHLLQRHLWEKLGILSPQDPLKTAALLFKDEFLGRYPTAPDFPVCLFETGSALPKLREASKLRPTEYFAHGGSAIYDASSLKNVIKGPTEELPLYRKHIRSQAPTGPAPFLG